MSNQKLWTITLNQSPELQSLNILYEFVKAYSLKEDPSIQRISIFNGANRRVLFENKDAGAGRTLTQGNNLFDKWFDINDD